jgi:hypothetical protein
VVMVVRREWGGIKEKEMARQCHFVSPKRNWIRTHTHRHTHKSITVTGHDRPAAGPLFYFFT